MKTNKALLINVSEKTITQIELGTHFGEISKTIGNGCEHFCCPYSFSNEDSMYADDESLLRIDSIKGGFVMEGYHGTIVGNAIILGTDDEGDSVDVKHTCDEIAERIIFIDEGMAKDYAKEVMSKPPMIKFF